jgi:hypothetical protein
MTMGVAMAVSGSGKAILRDDEGWFPSYRVHTLPGCPECTYKLVRATEAKIACLSIVPWEPCLAVRCPHTSPAGRV